MAKAKAFVMPTEEQMMANLRARVLDATPAEYEAGLDWYTLALAECKRISATSRLPVDVVVAVLAALSPRNKWAVNVVDTQNLISAYLTGGRSRARRVKVCTYNRNKYTALDILDTGDVSKLSGPKVTAFYANIMGERHHVTVDSHAMNAAVNSLVCLTKAKLSITPLRWNLVEKCYQALAAELDCEPRQAQAIVWIVERRWRGFVD